MPRVYEETLPRSPAPHYYGNPNLSISDIAIAAFYFLPRNKAHLVINGWRELLEENFKKIQEFHSLQLRGQSSLKYEIYPEPVIGYESNQFYDTDITQHGNPEALRRVAAEIEKRVFNQHGDLFRSDFARDKKVYRVLVIMYEGVGAAGSDNVAFVSRVFFQDPQYRLVSTSIVAHEFYHTLGIPDRYDIENNIPTSSDIMGTGRSVPLERTYLNQETLKSLGL